MPKLVKGFENESKHVWQLETELPFGVW